MYIYTHMHAFLFDYVLMQVAVPHLSCMEAAAGAQDCWEWTSQGTRNTPARVATLQPAMLVSPKRQSGLCVVSWAVENCELIFSDQNSTSTVCFINAHNNRACFTCIKLSEPWGIREGVNDILIMLLQLQPKMTAIYRSWYRDTYTYN